jgi:hypothetical protein
VVISSVAFTQKAGRLRHTGKVKSEMLIIVFSCNRAMQLEAMLRSITVQCSSLAPDIHVVFRTDSEHQESYRILRARLGANSSIRFIELTPYSVSESTSLLIKHSFSIANLYRAYRYPYVRRLRDDFKATVEAIMAASHSEFMMFQTDDTYYFRLASFPPTAAAAIREKPAQTSFRFYVGGNIEGCPATAGGDEVIRWDYYSNVLSGHWAYPFSVDGTIYHREWLLSFLRLFVYHMPTTLEAFIVSEVRRRKLLGSGLGPVQSSLVHFVLNRTQSLAANENMGINLEMLRDHFMDGYSLEYELPGEITSTPLKVVGVVLRRGRDVVKIL